MHAYHAACGDAELSVKAYELYQRKSLTSGGRTQSSHLHGVCSCTTRKLSPGESAPGIHHRRRTAVPFIKPVVAGEAVAAAPFERLQAVALSGVS